MPKKLCNKLPPLWAKLGQNSRLAGLDIHSPTYLKLKDDPYGIGDIGSMYKLISKASKSGFSLVQMNPINDTGNRPCPYMALGLFSYNPIHLDVSQILDAEEIDEIKEQIDKTIKKIKTKTDIDYKHILKFKLEVLKKSFSNLNELQKKEFAEYCQNCDKNILFYAMFKTYHNQFKTEWYNWPDEFKTPNLELVHKYPEYNEKIKFNLYVQWVLESQWLDLATFAQKKGIYLVIDKPIYPHPNSADVWANQSLFYLNGDGTPKYISGCNSPEDPFGEQKWGHAVYKFAENSENVINFFIENIRFLNQISQVIRLDHTLALIWKYYIIHHKNGEGKHLPALQHHFFQKIKQTFPDIYFIAEDLGFVSFEDIDKPLIQNAVPGMRCIQWNDQEKYTDLDSYPHLSIALTSNHDTDSLLAWWQNLSDEHKSYFIWKFFGDKYKGNINSQVIIKEITSSIFASKSALAFITLRDIVKDDRRYNFPGKKDPYNWTLRSPISLEDINFYGITKIINQNSRQNNKPKPRLKSFVLALQPTFDEIQRRKPGEVFLIRLALSKLPKKIDISTDLPQELFSQKGVWTTKIFGMKNENIKITEYSSNLIVIEIAIKIPLTAQLGSYELAANIDFGKDGTICLCRFGQNLKLEVW